MGTSGRKGKGIEVVPHHHVLTSLDTDGYKGKFYIPARDEYHDNEESLLNAVSRMVMRGDLAKEDIDKLHITLTLSISADRAVDPMGILYLIHNKFVDKSNREPRLDTVLKYEPEMSDLISKICSDVDLNFPIEHFPDYDNVVVLMQTDFDQ